MALKRKLTEPSSGGSLERFSFTVRLKPSLGGSRICKTTPYAAFIASIAPWGSPPKKTVSGGGAGSDNDTRRRFGFFTVACKRIRESDMENLLICINNKKFKVIIYTYSKREIELSQ